MTDKEIKRRGKIVYLCFGEAAAEEYINVLIKREALAPLTRTDVIILGSYAQFFSLHKVILDDFQARAKQTVT